MEIQIEATKFITEIGGVPVHLWNGVTKDGIECKVFVHRIAVNREADTERFDKELAEQMPPGSKIPLSYFLD